MFPRQRLLHCNRCGHALQYHVPPDDNRERAVCMACEHIQYENPLNVVGTVPFAAELWVADEDYEQAKLLLAETQGSAGPG